MFDVIGKRRIFYAISLALTIPGLVFILLTPFTDAGLQFTIDYTGGTRWELKFKDPNVTPAQVEAVFAEEGLAASAIRTGSGYIEIKTEPIGLKAPEPSASAPATLAPSASGSPGASVSADPAASASASPPGSPSSSPVASASPSSAPSASASPAAAVAPSGSPAPSASASASASPSASTGPAIGNTELPTDGKLGEMVKALEAKVGTIESQASLTTIGAVVSSDLVSQALILIVVGSLGIVLWITYRFRDVKFGVTALVALLHDVIVVVGTFAILGTFFNVEIDALFVTAMLTVIGFSVHDTIVVYDRIRENKARHLGEPFAAIVNHSILQTFGRSITTSLTVLITLLALFLFGGSSISDFILALLIGIVSGTYSSIFVASLLLVDWQARDDRRRGRVASTRAPRTRRVAS
ncbi:MAG: protein translocase subunit SecF [Chloroflexi bacterium]|nr:protein translocase subunit SecF [Chloroflexota bacterium]